MDSFPGLDVAFLPPPMPAKPGGNMCILKKRWFWEEKGGDSGVSCAARYETSPMCFAMWGAEVGWVTHSSTLWLGITAKDMGWSSGFKVNRERVLFTQFQAGSCLCSYFEELGKGSALRSSLLGIVPTANPVHSCFCWAQNLRFQFTVFHMFQ